MSKHTQGEWFRVKSTPLVIYAHDSSDNGMSWEIATVDDKFGPVQSNANARLIAAAPELLEALERLADRFKGRMADWENAEFHDVYNDARAAIAKAKGEA